MTQALITYSEFRGYDILLLLRLPDCCFHYQDPILRFVQDPPGRLLFRFTLWATIMSGVTIVSCYYYAEDNVWSLVTLVFLFHLWGFVLAYGAFRLFRQNTRAVPRAARHIHRRRRRPGRGDCLQAMDLLPLFGE